METRHFIHERRRAVPYRCSSSAAVIVGFDFRKIQCLRPSPPPPPPPSPHIAIVTTTDDPHCNRYTLFTFNVRVRLMREHGGGSCKHKVKNCGHKTGGKIDGKRYCRARTPFVTRTDSPRPLPTRNVREKNAGRPVCRRPKTVWITTASDTERTRWRPVFVENYENTFDD